MLDNRMCKMTPRQHMKLNSLGNLTVIILFMISFNLTWFSYDNTEFSLTQLHIEDDSWKNFEEFRKMCMEINKNKYKDLPEDCEMLDRFKLAGTMFILMNGFAMFISVYNTLASAAMGWNIEVSILDYQFPHVLSPIAYSVSIIIWIIVLNVGFSSEFYAKSGFYLADFTTAATYGLAVHHTIFFRLFEEKEDFSLLIN